MLLQIVDRSSGKVLHPFSGGGCDCGKWIPWMGVAGGSMVI